MCYLPVHYPEPDNHRLISLFIEDEYRGYWGCRGFWGFYGRQTQSWQMNILLNLISIQFFSKSHDLITYFCLHVQECTHQNKNATWRWQWAHAVIEIALCLYKQLSVQKFALLWLVSLEETTSNNCSSTLLHKHWTDRYMDMCTDRDRYWCLSFSIWS